MNKGKTLLEKLGMPFDPIGRTTLNVIKGEEIEERARELEEAEDPEEEVEKGSEVDVATRSKGTWYHGDRGRQMKRVVEALAFNPTKKKQSEKEEVEELVEAPMGLPALPAPDEVFTQLLAPLQILMQPENLPEFRLPPLPSLLPTGGREKESVEKTPPEKIEKKEVETEEPEREETMYPTGKERAILEI